MASITISTTETEEELISEVVRDFQKTDLYSDGFLKDLESGLKKSGYETI